MKRITRNRPPSPTEIEKYDSIRKQLKEELPELIAHFRERMRPLEKSPLVLGQVKSTRESPSD